MKKLSVIILMLFTLTAISQEVNQTDAKGRKQGVWQKFHQNGKLRYKGEFKNDQPIGTFYYYDNTGALTLMMKNDGDIGRSELYYSKGPLKAKGNYVDQKKDSIWNYYSIEGFKISEELYLNGVKEGVWKVYYKDGTLAEEKNYNKGFENGAWIQYYENGKKRLTATYENGSMEGKIYFYDAAGKKIMEGNYKHDARHGAWLTFDANGEIEKKEIFVNGEQQGGEQNILPDDEERTKQDVLEFEDMLPPR